jgi:hypothetical protein
MKDKRKFNETGFGKFCKNIASDIPSLAGDILEIATSGNPIGAAIGKVSNLLQGQAEGNNVAKTALAELQRKKMDWELEVYRAESTDRARASKSYMVKNKMADNIAESIIKKNLLFIALLLIFNILFNFLSTVFIDDKTIAVSIGSTIATAIGTVVGSLLQERNQVVGFFFGSSLKSKEFKVN